MAKSNALKRVALGAAVAGAAGYLAGILSAPTAGKKTRKQLRKSAGLGRVEVEKQLKQLHTELGEIVTQTKDSTEVMSGRMQKKFGDAVHNAHDAKDKLREVLSSIHEGQASDKDLQRALEDARRSLKHLKQFIRK